MHFSMTDFARPGSCTSCGRKYLVKGAALNPGNETQSAMAFSCECGGRVVANLPGSTNRSLVRLEPAPEGEKEDTK